MLPQDGAVGELRVVDAVLRVGRGEPGGGQHRPPGPAGQEPIVVGFDVVVTDEQGRIERVPGFLDKVPA